MCRHKKMATPKRHERGREAMRPCVQHLFKTYSTDRVWKTSRSKPTPAQNRKRGQVPRRDAGGAGLGTTFLGFFTSFL
jgi:hypothetical protein